MWKKEYSLKITLINNERQRKHKGTWEDRNALVNIAQEDDSNIFELLQNL